MEQLSNKVIWITGASSGIGKALTQRLINNGNRLIISSRNTDKLNAIKQGCQFPENVAVVPMDLADFEQMGTIVAAAINSFGKLDMLVNNAGISQRSLIVNTEFEVFKRLMDINYLGTLALTKEVLPHFIKNKKGHFITVTSLMGKFGSPLRSGYCAAKHGLHGFFDVLRMEHEKDGIAVTLVCPGFVQTNVAKNALTADGSRQRTNDTGTKNGMLADKFAQKMIRAIEQKKYEVYIGGKEVKGIYLKRFFPRLLHRVVMRSQVV